MQRQKGHNARTSSFNTGCSLKKITGEEVRKLLAKAPGVKVVDNPRGDVYALAIDAAGGDDMLVGMTREDESIPNGINMRVVADSIRKGAAPNAVQIAEILIRRYL
jgi:aspartate-semialdehyde dehydrogenase